MQSFLKAIVVSISAITIALPAYAQPATWSGLDGSLSITFPQGWRRLDDMLRARIPGSVEPDVLFIADKGDSIMGQPGVSCTLKANRAPMPAGQTSVNTNKKIRENPVLKKPLATQGGVERKATFMGDIVAIEGTKIAGTRDDYMSWTTVYASGDRVNTASIICTSNVNRTGITPEITKDVREMFAVIKVTPK